MKQPKPGTVLWMIDQIFEADLGDGIGAVIIVVGLILLFANLLVLTR